MVMGVEVVFMVMMFMVVMEMVVLMVYPLLKETEVLLRWSHLKVSLNNNICAYNLFSSSVGIYMCAYNLFNWHGSNFLLVR